MFHFVSLRRFAFALSAIAVLGLAGPASAQVQVPFQGGLQGSYTVTPLTPPFGYLVVTGVGQATQLGQFSLKIPHTVNFAAGTATGDYTFTAANGDQVYATLIGKSTLIGTEGRYVFVVETASIWGGTGRFAGAKGAFVCERLVDRTNLYTTGVFKGTISAPVNP
jgi:hypothetical protein